MENPWVSVLVIAGLAVALGLGGLTTLGVVSRRMQPTFTLSLPFPECRSGLNCASSGAPTEQSAHIPAIALAEPLADPAALQRAVRSWTSAEPKMTLLQEQLTADAYAAHLTQASPTFGFTDDVLLIQYGPVLQVYSAARVGQGDLGMNRARLERLRERLEPLR